MLLQIHHQYEDYTKMLAQKDTLDEEDYRKWFADVKVRNPLPKGASFMVCNERSPHFVMMVTNPIIDK